MSMAKIDFLTHAPRSRYQGARSLPALQKFIEEQVAADSYGRVVALDSLAAGFGLSTDQDSLIGKAKEALASLVGECFAFTWGAGRGPIWSKAGVYVCVTPREVQASAIRSHWL